MIWWWFSSDLMVTLIPNAPCMTYWCGLLFEIWLSTIKYMCIWWDSVSTYWVLRGFDGEISMKHWLHMVLFENRLPPIPIDDQWWSSFSYESHYVVDVCPIDDKLPRSQQVENVPEGWSWPFNTLESWRTQAPHSAWFEHDQYSSCSCFVACGQ